MIRVWSLRLNANGGVWLILLCGEPFDGSIYLMTGSSASMMLSRCSKYQGPMWECLLGRFTCCIVDWQDVQPGSLQPKQNHRGSPLSPNLTGSKNLNSNNCILCWEKLWARAEEGNPGSRRLGAEIVDIFLAQHTSEYLQLKENNPIFHIHMYRLRVSSTSCATV